MIEKYKRWTIRQANTAQCSPALGVLVGIIVLGVMVYVYRRVVLETLLIGSIGLTVIMILTLGTALGLAIRRHRAEAEPEPAMVPVAATDGDVAAITKEADWLATEGVELAFSPDGRTLKVKEK
jgi:cation transporter-like permease